MQGPNYEIHIFIIIIFIYSMNLKILNVNTLSGYMTQLINNNILVQDLI